MNALLNYYLMNTALKNNASSSAAVNMDAYTSMVSPNFVSPSFVAPSLANALAAVPGYNCSNVNFSQQPEDRLKKLLSQGIIDEKEYSNQLRKMYGFAPKDTAGSAESIDENGNLVSLKGKNLDRARKSSSEYPVEDVHSELASKYIDAAKEILKKDPELMTEDEIAKLDKVFSDVSENPMLSEEFVKEANATVFKSDNGKTTTVLGSYEQALIRSRGKKGAKNVIEEVTHNLKENVQDRNSKEWSKFEKANKKDSENVEYSFVDKAINNPVPTVALVAGGSYFGLKGAKTALGLCSKAPSVGKVAFGALAVGALAYGAYELFVNKEN